MPIIKWLDDREAHNRDAIIILSQKSTLELVEQTMEQILMGDVFIDPLDKKMYTVEKVAEAVGIDLQTLSIEADANNIMVEFFGQNGSLSIDEMKTALKNYTAPQGQNKFQREKSKKKKTMLLEILDAADSVEIDMFKRLKYEEMKKRHN